MAVSTDGQSVSIKNCMLPALGFAFFWPLYRPSSFTPIFAGWATEDTTRQAFGSVLLFEAILIITAVLLRSKIGKAFASRTLALGAGIGAGVLPIALIATQPASDSSPLFDLVLVLISLCHSVLALSWGCRFARMKPTEAVFTIVFAGAVSSACYTLLYYYNGLDTIRSISAPILSALLLALSMGGDGRDGARQKDLGVASSIRKLPLTVTVLSIAIVTALTFMTRIISQPGMGGVPMYERMLTQYGLVVFLTAEALFIYLNGFSRHTVRALFMVQVVLALFGLFLVNMLNDGGDLAYAAGIITLSMRSFEIYVLMVLAYWVCTFGLCPLSVFGLGSLLLFCLPTFVTFCVFDPVNAQFAFSARISYVTMAAGVSFAIFLTVMGVLGLNRTAGAREPSGERQAENPYAMSRGELGRIACERAAGGFDLTSRELDVMVLYYQGLSVGKVAEALSISPSTVQGYSRSLYRKLGIHSKQDLIEFVNAPSTASPE